MGKILIPNSTKKLVHTSGDESIKVVTSSNVTLDVHDKAGIGLAYGTDPVNTELVENTNIRYVLRALPTYRIVLENPSGSIFETITVPQTIITIPIGVTVFRVSSTIELTNNSGNASVPRIVFGFRDILESDTFLHREIYQGMGVFRAGGVFATVYSPILDKDPNVELKMQLVVEITESSGGSPVIPSDVIYDHLFENRRILVEIIK